jgi:hypothetical protein
MAACVSVSECGRLTVYLECSATVVQGENYHYELQLTGPDGLPVDINNYDVIVLRLFGTAVNINYEQLYYGHWSWPVEIDTETTGIIYSLQEEQSDGAILNKGIIAFEVSHDLTKYFTTGPLYAEIKLKKENTGTGNYLQEPEYYTITCLKIGNVKSSAMRDFNF